MTKVILDWLGGNWMPVALVLVCLYAMNQFTANQAKEEIIGLRLDAAETAKQKENLDKDVEAMTADKKKHLAKIGKLEDEVKVNIDYINDLEKAAREKQLKIRGIDTSIESLNLFVETFPEFSRDKGFGMVDVVSEKTGIKRSYLSMPIFFTETFVIEHNNLETAEKELLKYQENEELYGDARALRMKVDRQSDRIQAVLTDANNACHIRTEALRDRYINQLEKPRFELPGGAKMVGCAALGIGASWAIKKAW